MPLLGGCLGDTPERASISEARLIDALDGSQLEVTQQLRLSRTMLAALASGIPLQLVYRIDTCAGPAQRSSIELRYVALTRDYEMRVAGQATVRRFSRRSALLAALDRVRLPLPTVPSVPSNPCAAPVVVALDLTALPTPLRFPAFLQPGEWRLVSPPTAWHVVRG